MAAPDTYAASAAASREWSAYLRRSPYRAGRGASRPMGTPYGSRCSTTPATPPSPRGPSSSPTERGTRRSMKKLERIQAAIKRQPTDRTPYAFWRHFPDVDHSPAALAQSTLRFHERYGSDFLKVTPSGGYAVQDWGCV